MTQQEIQAANWHALTPQEQESVWAGMRAEAARTAAADGKTLTDTPGTRHVLWQRPVSDPEYLSRRMTECPEAEAETVRLRLSCWAAPAT